MRVYLFDIDGTLVSTGGAGKAAIESALLAEFELPGLRGQVPYSGRTDRAIVRDLFRMHALEDSPANWEKLRAGYLSRLPVCLTSHPGRVLPGIASLLDQLGARCDVAVGLLTGNIRDGARLKLGHFDLFRHFGFGGFGDLHLDRDDVAREALRAMHAHCQGPARVEEIWVIGDTPLDIRCARTIGARVLAVATGLHRREELEAARPDLVLDDLADPAPLLNLLDQAVA
jgi:phosphoglycolate phosphatase-like HAD superfamily hydrolase